MEENYHQPPLQTQAPTPKHKLNKANIVMAVLLVLALAAAITFAVLWATKKTDAPAENSNTSSTETVQHDTTAQPDEKTSTEERTDGNVLSTAEVENLLAKYIGEGNTQAVFLNAYYDTFTSNFDEQQKMFLTYRSIDTSEMSDAECVAEYYEQGSCTGRIIDYDLMSEKYKTLFGDYGTAEKKNYSFHNFFYLVYDDSINAYREYILPGGGTTSVVAMHKVVSVERSGNDIVASLTFATLNTSIEEPSERSEVVREPGSNPITMIYLPNSTVNEIIDSMAIYEFTLSPYHDSYILKDVKKI